MKYLATLARLPSSERRRRTDSSLGNSQDLNAVAEDRERDFVREARKLGLQGPRERPLGTSKFGSEGKKVRGKLAFEGPSFETQKSSMASGAPDDGEEGPRWATSFAAPRPVRVDVD